MDTKAKNRAARRDPLQEKLPGYWHFWHTFSKHHLPGNLPAAATSPGWVISAVGPINTPLSMRIEEAGVLYLRGNVTHLREQMSGTFAMDWDTVSRLLHSQAPRRLHAKVSRAGNSSGVLARTLRGGTFASA